MGTMMIKSHFVGHHVYDHFLLQSSCFIHLIIYLKNIHIYTEYVFCVFFFEIIFPKYFVFVLVCEGRVLSIKIA